VNQLCHGLFNNGRLKNVILPLEICKSNRSIKTFVINRWIIVILVLGFNQTLAQDKVVVSGTVIESKSGAPIPFATVAAHHQNTKKLVAATTSDESGRFSFSVELDEFYIEVSFIGFKTQRFRDFNKKSGRISLGTIALDEDAEILDVVEVRAEKSVVEFKLDRRVFNVGQDLATTGMGALDVLNNVPSVNVDIEGEVTLRGNAGVQILINGKPSVLSDDGSTALSTITADMIESIEVITNPSAKYEAEGSSGIINIILKKEEKKGFNGSVSLNTGIPDNHSIGVSLNRRTENFNFFTQFGAGYRSIPRYRKSVNNNLEDGTRVESEGTEYRNERFFNITLGTDYHINDLNVLTLSGSFAFEDEDQPSETDFLITDAEGQTISQYERSETTTAENPKYQYDLQYEKKFANNEDHVLQISAQGSYFGKDQESDFVNTPVEGAQRDPNQQTETHFYQRDYIFKLDYVNPLTEIYKIEAGAQYDINDVGNDYAVYNQSPNGEFVIDSNLTNDFRYDQKVLGIYATGSYEKEKWGVKLGARVELTDLNTFLVTTNQSNSQNFANLFPSFHATYKVSKLISLQAGYSRRIYRPRLWDLNPFFNIRNNYNIRMGNPQLEPQYSDSYEVTAIFILNKASFNTSLYNLYTTNIIERISVLVDNRNVTMPVNIGTRNQAGFELNGKYTPVDWFTLNGDFNFGYFVRNGDFEDQNFDFNGTQWFTRWTGRFKLKAGFEFEVTGQYNSPYNTVQGEMSGFAFADLGARKKLWEGKGVINLSIRDVFASRIRERFVYEPTFELYNFAQRGRFITLGFSYSFGKGEAMSYTGRRR
jgi:outer membrane receptor protein involved in Fe transport